MIHTFEIDGKVLYINEDARKKLHNALIAERLNLGQATVNDNTEDLLREHINNLNEKPLDSNAVQRIVRTTIDKYNK